MWVAIPSKFPDFENLRRAFDADVRAKITREGIDIAVCDMVIEPVRWPATYVSYKLHLNKIGDTVRAFKGSCVGSSTTRGEPAALPELQQADMITVVRGGKHDELSFLRGFAN